jgi:hypothetical protein
VIGNVVLAVIGILAATGISAGAVLNRLGMGLAWLGLGLGWLGAAIGTGALALALARAARPAAAGCGRR